MKKAEEYLKKLEMYFVEVGEFVTETTYEKSDIVEAIKQAQKDAIDKAVNMCADEAETHSMWEEDSETYYESIDRESILQVADKLKKQIYAT